MKINLLTCSSKIPTWLDQVVGDYEKKISFWHPFSFSVMRSPSLDRAQAAVKKEKEADLFQREIKSDDFVIVCDEKGKNLTSHQIAERFNQVFSGGKKRILVLVGGAYGHGDLIKKRADLTLSLAPFTLNHHVACAVVAEQVYRAMTILKGVTYHN